MITKLAGYAHTGTNAWSEKVLPRRFFIVSKFLCGTSEIIWNALKKLYSSSRTVFFKDASCTENAPLARTLEHPLSRIIIIPYDSSTGNLENQIFLTVGQYSLVG